MTVFNAPGEIGKKYSEVAEVSASLGGPDFWFSPEQVHRAERKKAAQLGANGLILMHLRGGREVLYDGVALAIFIPEDSAKAAEVCAAARHAK